MQVRKLIFAVTATVAVSLAPTLMIAAGAGATAKTERFSFVDTSTSAGPPVFSVIATGDFVDGGTATQPSKAILTLRLSAGTIIFHTATLHKNVTKSQTATACIQTEISPRVANGYTIAGGTGAYEGIKGSGGAILDITFVEKLVKGDCSSAFTAVQGYITASGPISLP